MPRLGRRALGLLVGSALSACMVGPDYHQPEMPVPASFSEAGGRQGWAGAASSGQWAHWWTQFNDRELESLVERALQGNLDLQQAESRIRQARAQLRASGAALWPEVDAAAGLNHVHSSQALVQAFGSQSTGGSASRRAATSSQASSSLGANSVVSPGPPTTLDLYQLGFDATWELDLWGGTRRSVEAAVADAAAAVEDARGVQVSLSAEVGRNYVVLRALQRRITIAEDNLALQRRELALARARFRAGLASELDVQQLAAEVATTEAVIPSEVASARQTIHALALLLGKTPDVLTTELEPRGAMPPLPPGLPTGIPSDLLRRRPDIRRAERQLAAATARIGVATAALFPRLDLTAAFGVESLQAKTLLDWGNHFYSLFPSLRLPLFDAGRIGANIDVAREGEQQAAVAYRAAVLSAIKDVEDALAAYRTDRQRQEALARAVAADSRALELARAQYARGLVTVLSVLDGERALLAAEDNLVQNDQSLSTDLIALYKALGGGWEEAAEQQPPNTSAAAVGTGKTHQPPQVGASAQQ